MLAPFALAFLLLLFLTVHVDCFPAQTGPNRLACYLALGRDTSALDYYELACYDLLDATYVQVIRDLQSLPSYPGFPTSSFIPSLKISDLGICVALLPSISPSYGIGSFCYDIRSTTPFRKIFEWDGLGSELNPLFDPQLEVAGNLGCYQYMFKEYNVYVYKGDCFLIYDPTVNFTQTVPNYWDSNYGLYSQASASGINSATGISYYVSVVGAWNDLSTPGRTNINLYSVRSGIPTCTETLNPKP